MKFSDLNLNKSLLSALEDLSLEVPTNIQVQSFSPIMSGRDVIGIAQTGTGKTFAYLLPTLRMWSFSKDRFPQILVIVPTRELVIQVSEEIQKLTKYMSFTVAEAYGGANLNKQAQKIDLGCDAVVSTPGRLLDLCLHGALKLKNIKKFIIDECDEMLNLGFLPQIKRIIDFLPPKRQNLLYSATMTEEVEAVIMEYFNFPTWVEAAPMGTPLENIEQSKMLVNNFNTKINLLESLLADIEVFHKVLLFVNVKRLADKVFELLSPVFPGDIDIIHSNKSQNYRFNAVGSFSSGDIRILIATDVVARGIDVSDVSHVINFDIPEEPENYIHRIGRTGRADKIGKSLALFTEKEKEYLEAIETLMNQKIVEVEFPKEVLVNPELIEEELDRTIMKDYLSDVRGNISEGGAFHEKKDKNKKTNNPIRKAERMRLKYKKPKTRGSKKKGRRK